MLEIIALLLFVLLFFFAGFVCIFELKCNELAYLLKEIRNNTAKDRLDIY